MSNNTKYYLWGIGKEVQKYYNVEFMKKIDGFCDSNIKKQGKRMFDKVIEDPQTLLGQKEIFFIVSSIYEYDSIKNILIKNGYKEFEHFVWGPYWCGNEDLPSTYGYIAWKDYDDSIDFQSDRWTERAKTAVGMLQQEYDSVIDMGAGALTIKKYLKPDTAYFPVDYCKRFEEVIVCDFEKEEYPNITSDVVFALGILEYISNADLFVEKICNMSNTVIISYNVIEKKGNFHMRQRNGWVNHFKTIDIISLFRHNGFSLTDERLYGGMSVVYKFEKNRFQ